MNASVRRKRMDLSWVSSCCGLAAACGRPNRPLQGRGNVRQVLKFSMPMNLMLRPRPSLRRILVGGAGICLLAVLCVLGYVRICRPSPMPETEIFRGIHYQCVELPPAADAVGRMCIIRADLGAPGVGIVVTPMDPDAVAAGWEYRMRWPDQWVKDERLAAAMTATMFEARHPWLPLPGAWTRSGETVVADYQVNHVDPNTYLLWIDDGGLAHMELTKPPSAAVLARAKWGVGGQGVMHCPGMPPPVKGEVRDRRCVVGIDRSGKQLFLATFESATLSATGRRLAALGVEWAMPLDGGASASLTIGPGAHGVPTGPLMLPWRGVPTMIGVRAIPVLSP